MANSPTIQTPNPKATDTIFTRTRLILLSALLLVLTLCLVFVWTTRDAMSHLPFMPGRGKTRQSAMTAKSIVDLSPWQTAEALAALAVTAEENDFAREAERLADHEVDQAFGAALREAALQAQHKALSGNVLALSQKIEQLRQVVAQDQSQVARLIAAQGANGSSNVSPESSENPDLELAKAQLGLDSDELDDATQDLARATGDKRPQIQSELSAHQAAMKKQESDNQKQGQLAVVSARRYGTLAGRLIAWNNQRTRGQLLNQAIQQTQSDIGDLTAKHNALEASVSNNGAASQANTQGGNAQIASLRNRSAERQLLSLYDDRIQTDQELVVVYQKWAAQVQLQHRILLHLMLQSLALVIGILISMILGDAVVRRIMQYPLLDRRRRQTLRTILEVAIQIVGFGCILLVIFGAPRETATMLGLATAALTIALQDFVLAFFGWFVLMGRKGMRVGDIVEVNSVGGEVVEIGLMSTTLLETGTLADRGYPTGRRITFMNSFAIRGQYFNFSTSGQWMLDHFSLPTSFQGDMHSLMEKVQKVVDAETGENTHKAIEEWKRVTRSEGLIRLASDAAVSLRPSAGGFDLEVRYVTRASERSETRNHLYERVMDVLHEPAASANSN